MPGPVIGAVGASFLTSAYGARQQKKASDKAIDAQSRASDQATEESARQFDLVREDTRVARETGDQAMIAMGYLMGTRKPPSSGDIQSMRNELQTLQGSLEEKKQDKEGLTFSDPSGFGADIGAMREFAGRQQSSATDIGGVQKRIDELTSQIESAEQERNIAMELGGGRGEVPDISTLFEGVDLPTGENIGSPDSYLPDLDNFLQGLGEDLENSRGYQFELKQGREALQNTLSQKGTAYGGNAIKEALQFSQDYASTKYGERFGQALQEYDRETQSGMTRYGMDMDKYNRERQEAFDQYGMNMDKYRLAKEKDDTRFGRLATMSGYGPVGTQVSANAGQNYAQTVAQSGQNLASTTGQGAYSVAGANTQALSNVANTGMTMYQYNRMMDTMGG